MSELTRTEIKQAVAEAVTETGVLTDAEVRRIVKDTVHETLAMSGIDPNDAKATNRDLQFVREWRQTTETVKQKGLITLIGVVVTGACAIAVLGIKAALRH